MKKIGILGGSFMPIHNGHIEMANTAYHELNLDEIWILPNGIPPYKRVTEEISVLSRLALIQAMIKSYPYMKICDYEVRKSSFQYSYETLSYFHEKYPDYELYFIIGEDSIDYFDEWRKPEIIVKNCRIVVCGRSSSDFKSLDEKCKSYSMKYQASFILFQYPLQIFETNCITIQWKSVEIFSFMRINCFESVKNSISQMTNWFTFLNTDYLKTMKSMGLKEKK